MFFLTPGRKAAKALRIFQKDLISATTTIFHKLFQHLKIIKTFAPWR
jgi:hypothetical protein